jgi:hypothetical protein
LPSTFPPTTFASFAAFSSTPARAQETSYRTIPRNSRTQMHLRREVAAYGRLLAALDELVIVPDDDLRTVLGELAKVIDSGNEYPRVVTEHEALHGLLDQLGGGQNR